MDADDSPTIIENEKHFWEGEVWHTTTDMGPNAHNISVELDTVLEAPCETHEDIDDALRSYIALTTQFKSEHTDSREEVMDIG